MNDIFASSLPVSLTLKNEIREAFTGRDSEVAAGLMREFGADQIAVWLGELLADAVKQTEVSDGNALSFAREVNRLEIVNRELKFACRDYGLIYNALKAATESRQAAENRLGDVKTHCKNLIAANQRLVKECGALKKRLKQYEN